MVPTKNNARVFIVEDSILIRSRIKLLLTENTKVNIVGEADCAVDAIKYGSKLLPDVMVLDINLLGNDTGFLVLKEMKQIHPSLITIVLTNYANDQYRKRSMDLGADFFFDKSNQFNDMIKVLN